MEEKLQLQKRPYSIKLQAAKGRTRNETDQHQQQNPEL